MTSDDVESGYNYDTGQSVSCLSFCPGKRTRNGRRRNKCSYCISTKIRQDRLLSYKYTGKNKI